MCYHVVERYANCRCLYHAHPVDACPALGQRGHPLVEKIVLIGDLCAAHFSSYTEDLAIASDGGEIGSRSNKNGSSDSEPSSDIFRSTIAIDRADTCPHMLEADDQGPVAHLAGHAHTLLPSEASRISGHARSVCSSISSNDTHESISEISRYTEEWDSDGSKNQSGVQSPNSRMFEDDVIRSVPVEIFRPSLSSSHGTGSLTGSTSTTSHCDNGSLASSKHIGTSVGKRRRLKSGGLHIADEELRTDLSSLDSSGALPSARFACPYFKRNAARHQIWRSCAGPGWDTVHRTKEHVYRRHKLPITCGRCNAEFGTDKEMREHSRLPIPCDIVETASPEGFDNDQERQLKIRKRPAGQTEVERWTEMYRILFPEDPEFNIPTPHYDTSESRDHQSLCDFKDHLVDTLPDRILGGLKGSGIQIADEAAETRLYFHLINVISQEAEALFRTYLNPAPKSSLIAQSTTPKASHLNGLHRRTQQVHKKKLLPAARRPPSAASKRHPISQTRHSRAPDMRPSSPYIDSYPSTLPVNSDVQTKATTHDLRPRDPPIEVVIHKSRTLQDSNQDQSSTSSEFGSSWDELVREIEMLD